MIICLHIIVEALFTKKYITERTFSYINPMIDLSDLINQNKIICNVI